MVKITTSSQGLSGRDSESGGGGGKNAHLQRPGRGKEMKQRRRKDGRLFLAQEVKPTEREASTHQADSHKGKSDGNR